MIQAYKSLLIKPTASRNQVFQDEHQQNLVEKEEALVFRDTDVSQKLEYSKKTPKTPNKCQTQYFHLRMNAIMQ